MAPETVLQDPTRLEAPLDFASLKEVHKGSQDTLIIHIQDAHSNLSGQQNLASTLDYLMSKYGLSLVLVEGSSKEATLTPLKKAVSPQVCKQLAKSLLMEGQLAGEEYLNLTSDHPMKIMGVENRALYFKSVENYAALADKREEILLYLKSIQRALDKLKTKLYSKELLNYEKSTKDFETNFKALSELAQAKSVDLSRFPNIQKLIGLQKREQRIDFEQANLEQAALLEEIQKKGAGEDLGNYLKKANQAKNSKASQFTFFENTFNIAKEKNIQIQQYPNLMAYGDYLKDFSEIDLDQALDEFSKAEDKIYIGLLPEKDARLIRAIDRYVKLLDTAYRIQMTTKDFKLFEANEPDFSTMAYLAFINRKLAELGFFDDLIPYKDLLEEGKKALEGFYDSVAQRDIAFIQNTDRILKEQNQKVAVLISGGYHTPHLKELFQKKGYSYAVLTPIVTSETNQRKYEKLLLSPIRKETKTLEAAQMKSKPDESLGALGKDFAFLKKKEGVRFLGAIMRLNASDDPKAPVPVFLESALPKVAAAIMAEFNARPENPSDFKDDDLEEVPQETGFAPIISQPVPEVQSSAVGARMATETSVGAAAFETSLLTEQERRDISTRARKLYREMQERMKALAAQADDPALYVISPREPKRFEQEFLKRLIVHRTAGKTQEEAIAQAWEDAKKIYLDMIPQHPTFSATDVPSYVDEKLYGDQTFAYQRDNLEELLASHMNFQPLHLREQPSALGMKEDKLLIARYLDPGPTVLNASGPKIVSHLSLANPKTHRPVIVSRSSKNHLQVWSMETDGNYSVRTLQGNVEQFDAAVDPSTGRLLLVVWDGNALVLLRESDEGRFHKTNLEASERLGDLGIQIDPASGRLVITASGKASFITVWEKTAEGSFGKRTFPIYKKPVIKVAAKMDWERNTLEVVYAPGSKNEYVERRSAFRLARLSIELNQQLNGSTDNIQFKSIGDQKEGKFFLIDNEPNQIRIFDASKDNFGYIAKTEDPAESKGLKIYRRIPSEDPDKEAFRGVELRLLDYVRSIQTFADPDSGLLTIASVSSRYPMQGADSTITIWQEGAGMTFKTKDIPLAGVISVDLFKESLEGPTGIAALTKDGLLWLFSQESERVPGLAEAVSDAQAKFTDTLESDTPTLFIRPVDSLDSLEQGIELVRQEYGTELVVESVTGTPFTDRAQIIGSEMPVESPSTPNEHRFEKGVLYRLIDLAKQNPGRKYVFKLDQAEAVPAQTLSALNQLLAVGELWVPETGEKLALPDNLKIIYSITEGALINDPALYDRFNRKFLKELSDSDLERLIHHKVGLSEHLLKEFMQVYASYKKRNIEISKGQLLLIASYIKGASEEPWINSATEDPWINNPFPSVNVIKTLVEPTPMTQDSWKHMVAYEFGFFLKLRSDEPPQVISLIKSTEDFHLRFMTNTRQLLVDHVELPVREDIKEKLFQRLTVAGDDPFERIKVIKAVLKEETGLILTEDVQKALSGIARSIRFGSGVIRLSGASGAGKTFTAQALSKLLGIPYYGEPIHGQSKQTKWLGDFKPNADGNYRLDTDKPFRRNLEQGGVTALSELNAAVKNDTAKLGWWLIPLARGDRKLTINEYPGAGEGEQIGVTLERHKDSIVIIDYNPSKTFVQRGNLPSLLEAYTPEIHFSGRNTIEELEEMSFDALDGLPKEDSEYYAKRLASFHYELQEELARENRSLGKDEEHIVTPRELYRAAEMIVSKNASSKDRLQVFFDAVTLFYALSFAQTEDQARIRKDASQDGWDERLGMRTYRDGTKPSYSMHEAVDNSLFRANYATLVSTPAGLDPMKYLRDLVREKYPNTYVEPIAVTSFLTDHSLFGGFVPDLEAEKRGERHFLWGEGIIPRLIREAVQAEEEDRALPFDQRRKFIAAFTNFHNMSPDYGTAMNLLLQDRVYYSPIDGKAVSLPSNLFFFATATDGAEFKISVAEQSRWVRIHAEAPQTKEFRRHEEFHGTTGTMTGIEALRSAVLTKYPAGLGPDQAEQEQQEETNQSGETEPMESASAGQSVEDLNNAYPVFDAKLRSPENELLVMVNETLDAELRIVREGMTQGKITVLKGKPGGGKTDIAIDVADRFGLPSHVYSAHGSSDLQDWVGSIGQDENGRLIITTDPDENGHFKIPFLEFLTHGGVFVIDEGGKGKKAQSLLSWLTGLARGDQEIWINVHPGRPPMRLKKHPHFHLIITTNDAEEIPAEVLEASVVIEVPNTFSSDSYKAILRRFHSLYSSGEHSPPTDLENWIERQIDAHQKVIEFVRDGDLENPDMHLLTLRDLKAWTKSLYQFYATGIDWQAAFQESFRLTYLAQFDPDSRAKALKGLDFVKEGEPAKADDQSAKKYLYAKPTQLSPVHGEPIARFGESMTRPPLAPRKTIQKNIIKSGGVNLYETTLTITDERRYSWQELQSTFQTNAKNTSFNNIQSFRDARTGLATLVVAISVGNLVFRETSPGLFKVTQFVTGSSTNRALMGKDGRLKIVGSAGGFLEIYTEQEDGEFSYARIDLRSFGDRTWGMENAYLDSDGRLVVVQWERTKGIRLIRVNAGGFSVDYLLGGFPKNEMGNPFEWYADQMNKWEDDIAKEPYIRKVFSTLFLGVFMVTLGLLISVTLWSFSGIQKRLNVRRKSAQDAETPAHDLQYLKSAIGRNGQLAIIWGQGSTTHIWKGNVRHKRLPLRSDIYEIYSVSSLRESVIAPVMDSRNRLTIVFGGIRPSESFSILRERGDTFEQQSYPETQMSWVAKGIEAELDSQDRLLIRRFGSDKRGSYNSGPEILEVWRETEERNFSVKGFGPRAISSSADMLSSTTSFLDSEGIFTVAGTSINGAMRIWKEDEELIKRRHYEEARRHYEEAKSRFTKSDFTAEPIASEKVLEGDLELTLGQGFHALIEEEPGSRSDRAIDGFAQANDYKIYSLEGSPERTAQDLIGGPFHVFESERNTHGELFRRKPGFISRHMVYPSDEKKLLVIHNIDALSDRVRAALHNFLIKGYLELPDAAGKVQRYYLPKNVRLIVTISSESQREFMSAFFNRFIKLYMPALSAFLNGFSELLKALMKESGLGEREARRIQKIYLMIKKLEERGDFWPSGKNYGFTVKDALVHGRMVALAKQEASQRGEPLTADQVDKLIIEEAIRFYGQTIQEHREDYDNFVNLILKSIFSHEKVQELSGEVLGKEGRAVSLSGVPLPALAQGIHPDQMDTRYRLTLVPTIVKTLSGILRAWQVDKMVLAVGLTGVAKTTMGVFLAKLLGLDYYVYSVHGKSRSSDLTVDYKRTSSGSYEAQDQEFLTRVQKGNQVIVVDEAGIRPVVLWILNGIARGEKEITVEIPGQEPYTVKIGENVFFLLTTNPESYADRREFPQVFLENVVRLWVNSDYSDEELDAILDDLLRVSEIQLSQVRSLALAQTRLDDALLRLDIEDVLQLVEDKSRSAFAGMTSAQIRELKKLEEKLLRDSEVKKKMQDIRTAVALSSPDTKIVFSMTGWWSKSKNGKVITVPLYELKNPKRSHKAVIGLILHEIRHERYTPEGPEEEQIFNEIGQEQLSKDPLYHPFFNTFEDLTIDHIVDPELSGENAYLDEMNREFFHKPMTEEQKKKTLETAPKALHAQFLNEMLIYGYTGRHSEIFSKVPEILRKAVEEVIRGEEQSLLIQSTRAPLAVPHFEDIQMGLAGELEEKLRAAKERIKMWAERIYPLYKQLAEESRKARERDGEDQNLEGTGSASGGIEAANVPHFMEVSEEEFEQLLQNAPAQSLPPGTNVQQIMISVRSAAPSASSEGQVSASGEESSASQPRPDFMTDAERHTDTDSFEQGMDHARQSRAEAMKGEPLNLRLSEVSSYGRRLAKGLIQVFRVPEEPEIEESSTGMIINVMRYVLRHSAPFDVETEVLGQPDLALGVTYDASGSMASFRPALKQINAILLHAFQEIGKKKADFSISIITEEFDVIKGFKDRYDLQDLNGRQGEMETWLDEGGRYKEGHRDTRGGGIHLYNAVSGVIEKYRLTSKQNKLEFVFTDGGDTGGDLTRDASGNITPSSRLREKLDEARRLGIEIVGVGFNTRDTEIFDSFIQLDRNKSEHLIEAVLKIAKRKATSGKLPQGNLVEPLGINLERSTVLVGARLAISEEDQKRIQAFLSAHLGIGVLVSLDGLRAILVAERPKVMPALPTGPSEDRFAYRPPSHWEQNAELTGLVAQRLRETLPGRTVPDAIFYLDQTMDSGLGFLLENTNSGDSAEQILSNWAYMGPSFHDIPVVQDQLLKKIRARISGLGPAEKKRDAALPVPSAAGISARGLFEGLRDPIRMSFETPSLDRAIWEENNQQVALEFASSLNSISDAEQAYLAMMLMSFAADTVQGPIHVIEYTPQGKTLRVLTGLPFEAMGKMNHNVPTQFDVPLSELEIQYGILGSVNELLKEKPAIRITNNPEDRVSMLKLLIFVAIARHYPEMIATSERYSGLGVPETDTLRVNVFRPGSGARPREKQIVPGPLLTKMSVRDFLLNDAEKILLEIAVLNDAFNDRPSFNLQTLADLLREDGSIKKLSWERLGLGMRTFSAAIDAERAKAALYLAEISTLNGVSLHRQVNKAILLSRKDLNYLSGNQMAYVLQSLDFKLEATQHAIAQIQEFYRRYPSLLKARDSNGRTAIEILDEWTAVYESMQKKRIELDEALKKDPELRASLEALSWRNIARVQMELPNGVSNDRWWDIVKDALTRWNSQHDDPMLQMDWAHPTITLDDTLFGNEKKLLTFFVPQQMNKSVLSQIFLDALELYRLGPVKGGIKIELSSTSSWGQGARLASEAEKWIANSLLPWNLRMGSLAYSGRLTGDELIESIKALVSPMGANIDLKGIVNPGAFEVSLEQFVELMDQITEQVLIPQQIILMPSIDGPRIPAIGRIVSMEERVSPSGRTVDLYRVQTLQGDFGRAIAQAGRIIVPVEALERSITNISDAQGFLKQIQSGEIPKPDFQKDPDRLPFWLSVLSMGKPGMEARAKVFEEADLLEELSHVDALTFGEALLGHKISDHLPQPYIRWAGSLLRSGGVLHAIWNKAEDEADKMGLAMALIEVEAKLNALGSSSEPLYQFADIVQGVFAPAAQEDAPKYALAKALILHVLGRELASIDAENWESFVPLMLGYLTEALKDPNKFSKELTTAAARIYSREFLDAEGREVLLGARLAALSNLDRLRNLLQAADKTLSDDTVMEEIYKLLVSENFEAKSDTDQTSIHTESLLAEMKKTEDAHAASMVKKSWLYWDLSGRSYFKPEVRIYLNVKDSDSAKTLVGYLTKLHDDESFQFRFKTAADPVFYGDAGRFDNTLIYIQAEDLPHMLGFLMDFQNQNSEVFATQIPLFAKKIAPGIAVVQDMPSSKSFNKTIASALTKAIGREGDLLENLKAAIREEGLDPEKPFAALGSGIFDGLGQDTSFDFKTALVTLDKRAGMAGMEEWVSRADDAIPYVGDEADEVAVENPEKNGARLTEAKPTIDNPTSLLEAAQLGRGSLEKSLPTPQVLKGASPEEHRLFVLLAQHLSKGDSGLTVELPYLITAKDESYATMIYGVEKGPEGGKVLTLTAKTENGEELVYHYPITSQEFTAKAVGSPDGNTSGVIPLVLSVDDGAFLRSTLIMENLSLAELSEQFLNNLQSKPAWVKDAHEKLMLAIVMNDSNQDVAEALLKELEKGLPSFLNGKISVTLAKMEGEHLSLNKEVPDGVKVLVFADATDRVVREAVAGRGYGLVSAPSIKPGNDSQTFSAPNYLAAGLFRALFSGVSQEDVSKIVGIQKDVVEQIFTNLFKRTIPYRSQIRFIQAAIRYEPVTAQEDESFFKQTMLPLITKLTQSIFSAASDALMRAIGAAA